MATITAHSLRDDVTDTISHIRLVANKISNNSGPGKVFDFADGHELAEGLFLSAWTHWEEFARALLLIDLCSEKDSALLRDVKEFRTKGAGRRLAEKLLDHPDSTKFGEWSVLGDIKARADTFLGTPNRFDVISGFRADFETLKWIRNAIALKSDRAWESFCKLVTSAPFNLQPRQMKGITVGRFLAAHRWKSGTALEYGLQRIEDLVRALVP